MKIIVIIEQSNGNETVGQMWKETKMFEDKDTLKDVFQWVDSSTRGRSQQTNITLTVAH